MKIIRTSLLIAAIITANHLSKIAATPLSTASDLSVMVEAVEATTPLAASNAPLLGNFYSAQHAPGSASPWPPLPGNISDSPVWNLGDGLYLLDDLDVSYAKSMTGMHALDDTGPPLPGGGDGGTNSGGGSFPIYTFPTNGLWLQVTNIANGLVYLNLMNATDSVYEILSKTDLTLTHWTIEPGEVWPTNTNAMPFTVNQAGRTNLFLWAADWTGVTENGNTTPNWWFWEYFGTTDLSDTNLDSTGENTLLYDYQNDLDPNVISFTMSFTNYNVNTSPAYGAVTITGGTPFYEAILLNDTNEADAVWEPYTSTNVTVPLTWGNGLYTVSVGLRGLPTNATPTWLQAQLTFNNLAPTLTLTNPTTSTVSTPLIQLQGYVSVSLSKLTFDVSNAAGVFTNQQGYWQPLFYDTNLMQFTTNSFQCYDVALTNGLNSITLHATDGAGNSATTNFSYTLDYASATNAPLLSLIWPTNGTVIGGSNFTLQATVDDATASVTAFITDTNGDTNTVQALVERDGTVWVNNLPLNAGTNQVTLSATNAAGLSSQTNFEVIGNDVGLVVDPISGDQLNQPSVSVTGSINDTNDTVSVNGVAAYFTDDCGDWEADGVSVNPTGTAGLDVEVADADDNPVAAQAVSQPQPASVVISSYAASSANVYIGYVSWCEGNGPVTGGNATTDWVSGKGSSYDYGTTWDGECSDAPNVHDTAADLSGYTNDLPVTWENATASEGGDFSATISVQTTMMIEPAGQSTAKGNALYLVLASAMGFSDVGNLLNGYAGDTPLAPETLKVNGQTLVNSGLTNDDGSTWGMTLISAPSGATVPLTTTAPVGNTFTNQVQQVNLHIVDANSGTDLTLQTNTVMVGQQMNLMCQLSITNQFMTNFPPANFSWSVPGYAISNYVVAADSSSAIVVTNFPLNNSNVVFYWVDGANNRTVQCSATVNGNKVTGQATFNIYRPSVTFTDEPPSWATNDYIDGTLSLVLGQGDGGSGKGSMSYEVDVSSAYSGKTDFTQLINGSAANGNTSDTTGGQYWMDNTRFYSSQSDNPEATFNVETNYVRPLLFNDGPSFALAHSLIGGNTTSVFDQFKDYIMFRPDNGNAANNIYVPLGKITWSWSAATTYSDGIWPLPTYDITRPSNPDGGYEFPQWPQTYHNH